ncbi:DUF1642 domain-containing protein [Streptococcus suis]|uniref:DUF1642 domain-containing protein n=1 Tax=Streptococcus suis TaxID=1307 RepID=UPI0015531B0C|nr:DUF1642 domain-containing protein [Streptococcus suis]MCK3860652.1 DUF1642 domain-containing protein [Streptococcus suis]MCK4059489.1 DUF1642 domain-containing protein [Streptococcus suis]NQJ00160.1 DUF1642 domain-containing protein [Streptococcus suis]NQJ04754.1 DUF1642 domain-containing protein [Streptococcus suis]NQJ12106.1 DUF1642 domain-containing protein [Streptococcus suis]
MNKQEAIKRIEAMSFRDKTFKEIKAGVAKIISQIDQPQKVEVPAFIDSYIRYAKAEGMSLFIAMDNAQNKESEWIIKNEDIFTRAWLFGYQVEKERLYTVEVPSITDGMNMLHHSDNDWYFDEDINNSTSGDSRYHTKFDIEQAGFGWVFDCSGVKIVEVE